MKILKYSHIATFFYASYFQKLGKNKFMLFYKTKVDSMWICELKETKLNLCGTVKFFTSDNLHKIPIFSSVTLNFQVTLLDLILVMKNCISVHKRKLEKVYLRKQTNKNTTQIKKKNFWTFLDKIHCLKKESNFDTRV